MCWTAKGCCHTSCCAILQHSEPGNGKDSKLCERKCERECGRCKKTGNGKDSKLCERKCERECGRCKKTAPWQLSFLSGDVMSDWQNSSLAFTPV
ncbi:UNVERIFIED_CONTAM: hypothetical protein FKN15_004145 [Acipenser sinensis]